MEKPAEEELGKDGMLVSAGFSIGFCYFGTCNFIHKKIKER